MHRLKNTLYVRYHDGTATQRFLFTLHDNCRKVSIKTVIASLHEAQICCNQKHSGAQEMHPFNIEQ